MTTPNPYEQLAAWLKMFHPDTIGCLSCELREAWLAGNLQGRIDALNSNTEQSRPCTELATKTDLEAAKKEIMATVLDGLNALEAKLDKATTDIQAELDTLEAALTSAGTVTPEVQASLDRLNTKADALDALKPSTAQVGPAPQPPAA